MRMVQTRLASYGWFAMIATLFFISGPQSAAGQGAIPLELPTAPSATSPAPGSSSAAPNPSASAANVAPQTRVVTENGVQYRETRTIVRQPVQDVRYEDRPQTIYQQRYRTDNQQVNYYTQVPVTQYECVPRLYDWWRVFQGGYVAYGMEPYTTYQTQPQMTTIPVVRREVRPVTQTVKVAIPYLRFEERELVSRVPIRDVSAPTNPPLAPSYIPPTNVPPTGYVPRPTLPPFTPQYIPPSGNFSSANSISPRDPNALGGWSVATPVSGGATNRPGGLATPSYIPPVSTANASGVRSGDATDESRYGGVARFDGDPPRYGTGAIGRR